MSEPAPEPLFDAIGVRTAQIVAALSECSAADLRGPSSLPGWDRLTIACHLRYGAQALAVMTRATRAGEPALYYPQGRDRQRPETLRPGPDEAPAQVIGALAQLSGQLDETWRPLIAADWGLTVREPSDAPDLGPLPLVRLPLLRLTEVEVHGSDLDLGLPDWSPTFIHQALPFRIRWLSSRRVNHRDFDRRLEGSWLLAATDGPAHEVTVEGGAVEARPADRDERAAGVIEATSRDLLALLLGRPTLEPLTYRGDRDFAAAFPRAFPGP